MPFARFGDEGLMDVDYPYNNKFADIDVNSRDNDATICKGNVSTAWPADFSGIHDVPGGACGFSGGDSIGMNPFFKCPEAGRGGIDGTHKGQTVVGFGNVPSSAEEVAYHIQRGTFRGGLGHS